ncbi:glycosyltransferase family protein [Aestuariirhabdus sp. LZHN29]|uniref:glycosyltransferase family protein n=1 Tax=Aestuariirhabdus sp. LZHN29 TaxID=3417462 RepID=UPI003CE70B43
MIPAKPRILFYVQHLLGIGHLKRAALISNALERAGMEVHLVQGGAQSPISFPCAQTHYLPSISCQDANFSTLVDAEQQPVDDHYRARRRAQLLEIEATVRPDLLLLELYPFGRRQFRFELLPLISQVKSKNIPVVCSLRDILVQKPLSKQHRSQESADLVQRFFDAVLVHSDPTVIRLEDSFPFASQIQDKLRYTGYVADIASPPPARQPRLGVTVSAGGGAVGYPLLRAILQSKPATKLDDQPWTLITGPGLDAQLFDQLQQQGRTHNVSVERFREDFASLLASSNLSISQAGYNTTMDILATRTPALVIPYSEGGETEQLQRSEILQRHGYLRLLPESSLTQQQLVAAINGAATQAPPTSAIDLNGADASAQQLLNILQGWGL